MEIEKRLVHPGAHKCLEGDEEGLARSLRRVSREVREPEEWCPRSQAKKIMPTRRITCVQVL